MKLLSKKEATEALEKGGFKVKQSGQTLKAYKPEKMIRFTCPVQEKEVNKHLY